VEIRIELDEEREKILGSIHAPNPFVNHHKNRLLRQAGTGLWFIDSHDFRDWWDTPNSKLWLYGIPGAGKTVLASTIIDEAISRSSESVAIAQFYCDYKDSITQDISTILSSLIKQLAFQSEDSFQILKEFHIRHNPKGKLPVPFTVPDLCQLFLDMAAPFNSVAIVVDALDECGKSTVANVKHLASLHRGPAIKTLFLSRDEEDIRTVLSDYPEFSIAAQNSDLRLYVTSQLEERISDGMLTINDLELQASIVDKLINRAAGMYVVFFQRSKTC
jgi:Cdc6-like AAA superfamily ATPase